MTNKTYSFNKFSLNLAIPLTGIFLMALLFTWLFIKNKEWTLLVISAVLGVCFLLLVYYGFVLRKVTLSNDKAIYFGVNTYHEIRYSEIKSMGVFVQGSAGGVLLRPREIDKYSMLGVKFIYVSTVESPEIKNKPREGFICFQYRKSAYQDIFERLKELE